MANFKEAADRGYFTPDDMTQSPRDERGSSGIGKKWIIAGVLCLVALAVAGGIIIYRRTVHYDSYQTLRSADIDDGQGSRYIPFGDFFIKYGVDGISYIRGKETVWSQAYEMTNPVVDTCEDYIAVADKGTNTVYVFDKEGGRGQVTTGYPIISLEVANQGVVAALLEENTANYIEVYNRDGDLLISHKTLLNGNGYPMSFSLSDDGTKMIVSYVCVSSGLVESKVLFYNFSDVGQNEVDRMVGGFNQYKSTVVPVVRFLTDNTAVAVGDNILSIYKMKEKPSLEKEIKFKEDIQKVFFGKEYTGLVFRDSKDAGKNVIKAYSLNGAQVMDQPVDSAFEKIKFSGKNVLLYDDLSCRLISFAGRNRFHYRFKETVVDMIPTGKWKEYLVVTNNAAKKIRIKR